MNLNDFWNHKVLWYRISFRKQHKEVENKKNTETHQFQNSYRKETCANHKHVCNALPNQLIPFYTGRTNEIVARQEAPQYSQAAPNTNPLQQASSVGAYTRQSQPPPPLRNTQARPVDLGRLKSTPLPRASSYQSSRYKRLKSLKRSIYYDPRLLNFYIPFEIQNYFS